MSKMHYLVTNFQKSPSDGGSQPPAPLNLQNFSDLKCVIWPNCGFSNCLWRNQTFKNQLRHRKASPNSSHKFSPVEHSHI